MTQLHDPPGKTRLIRVPVAEPNEDQLDLFVIEEPPRVEGESIQQRFERFHAANPRVYQHLVSLARQARGRGFRRIGIETLWQVLRWEIALKTSDPSGFKLNDHYRSRYARLLMKSEADLDGLFELRKLRA